MHLTNYSLTVGKRVLISNSDISFETGKINHLIGRNGVGKSQLAKDFILNKKLDFSNDLLVVSSFSNIPNDLSVNDLFSCLNIIDQELFQLLALENIDFNIKIKHLSDGQKQKIKLLIFFSQKKSVIILDEITNAIDKVTKGEIYHFLSKYIKCNPQTTIVNITHSISDLKSIEGNFFLLENQSITRLNSLNDALNWFMEE